MTDLTGKSLLDRYYLREQVGSGGMADVYQAWDNLRSTRLAVKVLRRDLVVNPRFLRLFTQEASLYRKLEHPNIVRVYDFEREGDLRFIIMDWVEGSSLSEAIQEHQKPFDLGTVSRILQPISSALQYAHQHQVYHCDVKPANILLHKDGKVLLTDFGVARLADSSSGGGTAPYMAPEQFNGGNIGAQTDVYSLGATLYVLLSGGKIPFQGDSQESRGSTTQERIAWEHVNLPLPPLRQYNSDLSTAVQRVVSTAMEKNPSRRYGSTMDLREAFEHARIQREHGKDTGSTVLESLPKQLFKRPSQSSPPSQQQSRWKKSGGQARLYCRSGQYAGQTFSISSQGFTIGRSRNNQLQIMEKSVSRNHAVLWVTPQGTYIRDENSSLGTFVNQRRIQQPYRLSPGDVIQIGYYEYFEYQG
jgi:serine/threonine-protein kinase